MEKLLEIKNLQVDFTSSNHQLTAIKDVTLDIKTGETVCIVGESGSGKTVTSKTIMRLIDYESGKIAEGSIVIDGIDLTKLSPKKLRSIRGKKIAMIFQEPMAAFDPVFTIGKQIMETILEHKHSNKLEAKARAIYLLKRVGISDAEIRLNQYPNELSGGMLQRAMIAMALACDPDLLIADEPTTALDVTIQAQILQLLQELKEELGMSILLITHDMGVAAEMADRIIVMYAGSIVEQADVKHLFERPYHPYTYGLLQSITTVDSDRSKKLYSIKGSIPSLADLPSGCHFHPRCPFATDLCKSESPPLLEVNNRQTACWYAEEVTEKLFNKDLETKVDVQPQKEMAQAIPLVIGGEPLFEVQDLSKYYSIGKKLFSRQPTYIRAVDSVSFHINEGETFGLVGESGSGKSTLGRVLLQLEKPTSGEVFFQGQDLSILSARELREKRRDMQVIYQDPYGSVNPRWKIGDIIGEPLQVHETISVKDKNDRVQELLEIVGLNKNSFDRYPHEFSGGQRQRIAIARAIALNPKFILADEAVSALDVSVQAQIINLLQDIQRERNLTYLFIGHGLNIVRHISDRIGVMYLGQLVELANSEELFLHPAHHYTKGLIESIPVADPTRFRERITLSGEIPSPANPPSGCRFHTRCPAATARCREEQPIFREVSKGHSAACHHPV
ncbi:glutathione ABC transporter ATP-binding protein [Bacillus sp. AFS076308]|uniref:ABC transporter ATP-binding protein n=1 Tax=unclassified Bacillus (in: firmicutes) TaxID=185979 RepID=UPI000BF6F650|nr:MULTISPECIES: ABC transporter ATP-binding protein [unclassified Bacillus (in: firmicutes)]PFO01443.1 glutathione ABC transporter ATP-binding protein [Bacillus sp. AFS076308]PGV52285.1 glutathione ABC transporter ATP-binding protein [Bacillus sp. AFS037270]